ncbi:dipeptidase [Halalkalibaculum sp. DA3122]|uniref:dipeptidase n=1 Tax=Halalkalibaculum sp. DA3122 TaxID=3373607 RepID=UPI0037553173
MEDVQAYIESNKENFKAELFELLRIPSISTSSAHRQEVRKAANFLFEQLESLNLDQVTLFETDGNPIVYGELTTNPSKPTVLVYGHYDVQPPDPEALWETPPFEPTVRNGDIYARGASDDKGQSFTHLKALESYIRSGTDFPVNIKFIYEGEEEIGSPHLVPFIEEHRELLACDMVLISDTAMFAEDTPSITYGLRGLTYMEVEVTGPNRDLHSGVYGGAVENPAIALSNMIAQLIDEEGRIAIPGFYDNVKPLTDKEREAYKKLPFDEKEYKEELGLKALDGEKGYSTLERASARPTLDVNGLWSGYQGEGAKTVLPSKAAAKISMRLVPNQDPKEIARLFNDHIKSIAPETVTVEVTEHHGGHPSITDLSFYGLKAAAKAFEEIYAKEPLFTREGGSIPIVADFQRVLGAQSILMGFGLNSDAIHSPNEKFALKDFYRGIQTSAKFFEVLPEYG